MKVTWEKHGYLLGLLALMAVFFFLSLPLLSNVARWRGDERFYSDAVIGMTQSGHYFSPTYSDGSLRFKKPILTYWVVLSSYKALGISYFSTRLPFLIAGTLVVWLTYQLGLVLLRRRPEALVAAAIMASNMTVLHTSIRSTPDMILTPCLMISLLGFATLIIRGDRTLTAYGLAYLGAALAVATKGLSGLLPVLFAVGYVLGVKPGGMRARDLIHWPVLLVSLPIAAAWYIWAFTQHGDMAVADFWGDQVGERFSGSKWYILSNAVVYLSSFVIHLLPWSGLALIPLYQVFRRRLGVDASYWPAIRFMACWLTLLYVVFTFGNIQRTRYFLSAYPFLSLLYAILLCAGFRSELVKGWLSRGFSVVCWTILGFGVLLVVAGGAIHRNLILTGVILAGLALFVVWCFRRGSPVPAMVGFGGFLIVTFCLIDILVRPVFFVSPAPAVTRQILALAPTAGKIAVASFPVPYISQIHVLSEGRLTLVDVTGQAVQDELPRYPLFICPRQEFEAGQYGQGTLVGSASGYGGWRTQDFLALARPSKREQVWNLRRVDYYLIKPMTSSRAISPPRD